MMLAVAALIACGIAIPHLVRLERATPIAAAVLWGCSLALRALAGIFGALYIVFFLPATGAFGALTHWCLHVVVPVVAAHLGLSGHHVGDAAVVLPGALVAVSLLSAALGVTRATRAVRGLLAGNAVSRGPNHAVVVGGSGVLLAAAGLARPKLVVSAGALAQLDDEELAAGLDHERGHIVRRHRYVLVAADLMRALGRVVPGSRRAYDELAFHLERDADRWALGRRHDRLALASAICKAATMRTPRSAAFAALGGSGVTARLDELTGAAPPVRRRRRLLLNALAGVAAALTIAVALAVPATVQAGVHTLKQVERVSHCPT
jgi:Zn-dependent protease with chaperone function